MRGVPLILMLALAACATPPPVQPNTPSLFPPLASPSLPSLTPTPLPVPTATPKATLLPPSSPIPTRSPTPYSGEVQLEFAPWELVTAMAWSPDGGFLAVSAGDRIHLYQMDPFQEYPVLDSRIWSSSLVFSPEGDRLASAGRDGKIQIWDWAAGEVLLVIQAHKKGCNAVAYSPDASNLASAGNDGMVRIWDPATGELISEMIGGAFGIPAIAFTPDGSSLAIANADIIRIRDVKTGRFVQTLRGEFSFSSLAIAPDGLSLAGGGSNNLLLLWELPQGGIRFKLVGHLGENGRPAALIWQVAFSPDGSLLASAGGDQTVRVWNTMTGELVTTLTGGTSAMTSLAFSPDGRWLATGGLDARVRIWAINF